MLTKKLLVLSDSHGSVSVVKKVFNWAKERIPPKDTICGVAFCGDGVSDLKHAAEATGFYCDWMCIGGNNDYGYHNEIAVFEFAGHCFYMCHGHRHSMYGGHQTLLAAARKAGANAVLFGHSHVPYQKNKEGVLLLNPGSVARPRSRIGATFAVIECTEGEPLKAEFFNINDKGEISEVEINK